MKSNYPAAVRIDFSLVASQAVLPSFAFFLLAKVPPSFPRKESSFFLEDGDLGVGDFGEDGDFWGEEAMVVAMV